MKRPSILSDMANAFQIVLSAILLALCGTIAGDCLLQPPSPHCSIRVLDSRISERAP